MTQKLTLFNVFSMLLLLLSPILWIYGNPTGWTFEDYITIPVSSVFFLYYFVTKKGVLGEKNPLPKGLFLYFIYWGLAMMISSLIFPVAVIQGYLAFFLFFATFSQIHFINFYKFIAIISIVFFIIQEITFHTLGYRISGVISSLPLHYDMSMSEYLDVRNNATRSSSFFSEPAHFAHFLLPLLAIELFYDKDKYHFYYSLLIGVVLLFLQSGNGLFGLITILICAIPFFLREKKKTWIMFFLYFSIIIVGGYYFINSDIGEVLMNRQSELSYNYEGGSRSGFLRIWRGYYVFDNYSLIEKIFGCPNEAHQLFHVMSSGMLIGGSELYFNAIQKILLNTGLIGTGLFVFIIGYLWKGNSFCGRVEIIVLIVLSSMSAIYMSHTMIVLLVLAYGMKLENQEKSKMLQYK